MDDAAPRMESWSVVQAMFTRGVSAFSLSTMFSWYGMIPGELGRSYGLTLTLRFE